MGPDFVIARTHRSRHDAVGSPFDTAWDFSYNISAAMDGVDVVVNDGMGRSDKFFRQPNVSFQRAEFFREGSLNRQIFTLTLADKTIWTFRALNAAVAPGKIDAITDRNGNAMTFSYGVSGRLDQVTDVLGRTCQFSYNGSGQLTGVTDFAGRSVTYAYYGAGEPGGSAGDLKSMTSPAVTGTPNGNDFPLGKTVTYTYTKGFADERLNHNLTGVIDNTGVQVQTIAYTTELNPTHFDFDRSVSIAVGANPPTVFSCEPLTPSPANRYAKTKVTVNDPVGNVSEMLYDSKNRPVSIKELTGRATPGIPVTAVGNQPTNKLRASDPAFFETTMAYNIDSQVTQITEPRGNSMAMSYASDLSIATPVRERGNLRQVTQTPAPGVPSDQAQITEKFEYLPGFGTGEGVMDLPTLGHRCNHYSTAHIRSERIIMYTGLPGFGTGEEATGLTFQGHKRLQYTMKLNYSNFGSFSIKHTDPRGNVWTNQFDANGNLTSSQAPGLTTGDSFEYNAAGQLTAHVHPADANGRRKRDTFNYYSSGTQKGYLQSAVEDAGAGGLALTTTYDYDAVGNVTSVTDPRGSDTQFVFNQLDQLMQVKSAPGGGGVRQQVDFTYDDRIIDGSAWVYYVCQKRSVYRSYRIIRKDISNFDENGNPIGDGKITTGYGYDSIGRLTSVTDEVSAVASTVTQFEYDAIGQVTKVLSPLAVSGAAPFNTVQTQYDERGLPFQEISAPGSPDQSTTQYDYDANGNVSRVSRVSEGLEGTPRVTTVVADGFKPTTINIRLVVDVSRNRCDFIDDDDGMALARRAKFSHSSSTCRANVGGLSNDRTDPAVTIESAAAKVNRRVDITCPMLKSNAKMRSGGPTGPITSDPGTVGSARRWYGGQGYIIGNGYPKINTDLKIAPPVANPITATTHWRTSSGFASLPAGSGGTGPSSSDAKTGYAGFRGQPIAFAPGKKSSAVCNPILLSDNFSTITDPLGNTTTNHFDASGNMVSSTVTSPSGPVGEGNSVKLAETTYAYDALGRLTNANDAILAPTGEATGTGSNSAVSADNGQIISSTDPNGNATSYRYDTAGRISSVTDAKGNSTAYAYDANGNVTAVTNTLKSDLGNPDLVFTKSFAYDKLNRCTSATDNVGNTESFAYESRGNVVRTTDARGIVSQFA